MSIAYVDSSALVAVMFGEMEAPAVANRFRSQKRLYSSNLLEAEVRSACAREQLALDPTQLARIDWIFPDRPLESEMATILQAGYLRGADLWHLATALSATPDPREMAFITLDQRQRAVAAELGFQV